VLQTGRYLETVIQAGTNKQIQCNCVNPIFLHLHHKLHN